mgnify:CR=1 FL=1|jgi:hypothetical protein|tara:strand:+ start:6078 stop:6716 length:639 start_codon:yes stop_codon:yes gene_type:complete
MENKIILMLCTMTLVVTLIGTVSAEPSFIFQANNDVDLKIPVTNSDNSPVTSSTSCNMTIRNSNDVILVQEQSMSFGIGGIYNYTLTNTSDLGEYPAYVSCTDGSDYGFTSFSFEMTTTGEERSSSILDNSLMIIFVIIGSLLIGLGIYTTIPWFGFIGAIMFLLNGIYTMIYGLGNIADFYTQGIALTLIGLGFIFMFTSAYEWVWGGRED